MTAMPTKDFLRLFDWPEQAVRDLVQRSIALKRRPPRDTQFHVGKTVLLFFEKHSTRTRLSFQSAAHQLGAHSIFMAPENSQVARGEPLGDTAAMFGLFTDVVVIRTFGQDRIEGFAAACGKPVVNALTDQHHPCQILADVQTMTEEFGSLRGRAVAYLGDGNNITHSLAEAAAIFGFELRIGSPAQHRANSDILTQCRMRGASIVETDDPVSAVHGVSAVYTDTWTSMGGAEDEAAKAEREAIFRPYQVNANLMRHAAQEAIFLHCLPAYRGKEVTEDVLQSPASRIMPEAENRLHIQKALLDRLLTRP